MARKEGQRVSDFETALATLVRDAVRQEIAPLAQAVQAVTEKVGIARQVYTLADLWAMCGGKKVCTLESFRHRKDLPEPDSRNGRWYAFSRATVDAWLARKGKKVRA